MNRMKTFHNAHYSLSTSSVRDPLKLILNLQGGMYPVVDEQQ